MATCERCGREKAESEEQTGACFVGLWHPEYDPAQFDAAHSYCDAGYIARLERELERRHRQLSDAVSCAGDWDACMADANELVDTACDAEEKAARLEREKAEQAERIASLEAAVRELGTCQWCCGNGYHHGAALPGEPCAACSGTGLVERARREVAK